ncbi:MAG: PfkB family carbohydrate kinase [Candidatus Krumholzibacteria bacterium]|nr:PfkB family carbohydrate kinase [Candidatus Krumholzibacteria bacterium]MDH4336378.1 PfkB family carbohydrate kinase [Candidatus Krumholzibacteria bacterium]MDH5269503.1 PfkB family carbohydrate kinase [Candidatus Krumholzibacteria bacterium]
MNRFLDILASFSGLRVGVVGDFLLDQYVLGTTARVSREAPIVVVDYQDTVYHPGGAANAAQNVTALAGAAVAVGVLGADREGDALQSLLAGRGVDTAHLMRPESAVTSTKLRILAGEMNAQKQQVARVDRSHHVTLDAAQRKRLHAAVAHAAQSCGALLLADYGLGVLDGETIELAIGACRSRAVPVVVDSRHRMRAFRGATVATPNEVEAIAALELADESALTDPAALRRAAAKTGIESVIVTRGSKGMVVCGADGVESVGIAGNTAATDVTGAGDTVSAVVALSLAAGATVGEAARMATFAASVVVMKRGTATASPEEVRAAIESGGAR